MGAPKNRSAERRPFAAYRLPAGRHGIPPELVAENQRWRLLGAAAEVLAERGYARTGSADITRCAGVSSSTFYKYFDDLDACLLAAYEMAAECVCDLVAGACEGEKGEAWPDRLRAALEEALAFLASEPALASLLSARAPAGRPAIAAARERLINRLAWPLRGGRKLRGADAPELPPDAERRLLAAALGLIGDRVGAGEAARLPELAPELAELLAAASATVMGSAASSIPRRYDGMDGEWQDLHLRGGAPDRRADWDRLGDGPIRCRRVQGWDERRARARAP